MCDMCKKDDDIPPPLIRQTREVQGYSAPSVAPTSRTTALSSGGAAPSPEQLQINPFRREGKLLDLPMLFSMGVQEKVKVTAIPDTGATVNVISRPYLELSGSKALFRPTGENSLNMADGSTISTLGQLTMSCSFLDAPESIMQVLFQVCSNLAENIHVVVGKQFLEETLTLTRFAHRMTERTTSLYKIPRVMRLGTQSLKPRSQLAIWIDSRSFLAYPDTGSEIDLFSAAFAVPGKFVVRTLAANEPTSIQYANGRHEKILGKSIVEISIAKDASELNTEERYSDSSLSRRRTFYVVKNLACNIILGQAFLYSIDAYNTCKHAFVETEPVDGLDTLNGIFKSRNHDDAVPKAPSRFLNCGERHWKSLTCDTATASELRSALDKVDQKFITDKRTLDQKVIVAKHSSTRQGLEEEKVALKRAYDLEFERINKQYDDYIAQNPARR
jgi:hypothetical protein